MVRMFGQGASGVGRVSGISNVKGSGKGGGWSRGEESIRECMGVMVRSKGVRVRGELRGRDCRMKRRNLAYLK